jgi:hypothetical protein
MALRIGYVNRWKTGTVSASSAVAGLPASATQVPDRKYVWRSTTGTGIATIDCDFGAAQTISMCALANVKALSGGTVRFNTRGTGGSPGAASALVTLGTPDVTTQAVAGFFNPTSVRHAQFEFLNPGAVSDYAEAGFAFAGGFVEPVLNVLPGWSMDRDDPSLSRQSVGRQKQFATFEKFYAGRWAWDASRFADWDLFRALYDTVGTSTEVVFVLSTAYAWTTWLARLTGPLSARPSLARQRAEVSIGWEEVR